MKGKSPKRIAINRFTDITLRLFIDTNVLIDYTEKFAERESVAFIELFQKNSFANIELVTSDYVLWEFYGHFRDELYVRKLVKDSSYGYVSANKACLRGEYKKANLKDMESFGKKIKKYEQNFENNPVSVEHLIGKNLAGFSEMIVTLLQLSKFSYKDAIVFVSAIYTEASVIISHDETFSCNGHLAELKAAFSDLKDPLKVDIDFKKPSDFSTLESVKRSYRDWFIAKNKEKVIGTVLQTWPRKKVAAIECLSGNIVKVGDYLCLVRFDQDNNCSMNVFEVKTDNLQDYDTEKKVRQGGKVTVQIPRKESLGQYTNAMVFLYSYL